MRGIKIIERQRLKVTESLPFLFYKMQITKQKIEPHFFTRKCGSDITKPTRSTTKGIHGELHP
jgi:hypothetical protein